MLYSTCTIDRMENEENVTYFLEQHPEYELEEMHQIFKGNFRRWIFLARLRRN